MSGIEKTSDIDHTKSHAVVSGSLALVLRASRSAGMVPLSVSRARAAWRVAPSASLAALQRLLMTGFNIAILAGLGWDFCQEPDKRVRVGDSTLKAVVWISDMLLLMATASMAIYMGPSRMETPTSPKATTTGTIMGIYTIYYYPNIVETMLELQWYYATRAVHTASVALNQQLQQLRYGDWLVSISIIISVAFVDICVTVFTNFKLEPKSMADDLFTSHSVFTLVNSFTTQRNTGADIPMYEYPSQAQAAIRRLALSYDRISDVVIQLNSDNGPLLLVMMMSYSLRLVTSPYYLLLGHCMHHVDDDNCMLWRAVLQVCWIVDLFINVVLIVEPCHWTQEQREHTRLLLSQLTVHLTPKCERLSKELDQFAKLVTLNKAKFTPLGIFTLSRPLIATILGTATTYLIIIIQFRKISDLL